MTAKTTNVFDDAAVDRAYQVVSAAQERCLSKDDVRRALEAALALPVKEPFEEEGEAAHDAYFQAVSKGPGCLDWKTKHAGDKNLWRRAAEAAVKVHCARADNLTDDRINSVLLDDDFQRVINAFPSTYGEDRAVDIIRVVFEKTRR